MLDGNPDHYLEYISPSETTKIWKYRDWSTNFHQSIVRTTELYFSSAKDFDDQFEFTSNFDLEGASEVNLAMQDEFIVAGLGANPNEAVLERLKGRPERLVPQGTFELGIRNSMLNNFTVFCASRRNNIDLMWSEYARDYAGFCVGFHYELLMDYLKSLRDEHFESEAVGYVRRPPVTHPNRRGTVHDAVRKYLFSKSLEWKSEEEVRIVRYGESGGIAIPHYCVAGIVFGERMCKDAVCEIHNIIHERGATMPYFLAKKLDGACVIQNFD